MDPVASLGTRHDSRCGRMEDDGNYMTNIDWLGGIGLWELMETLCSCRLVDIYIYINEQLFVEKLCFGSVVGQVPGWVEG